MQLFDPDIQEFDLPETSLDTPVEEGDRSELEKTNPKVTSESQTQSDRKPPKEKPERGFMGVLKNPNFL
ncbi:MAG: hypothetical protein F6K32_07510, partial [Desertifilum sp. SIO1I2]|nr:hypothetical protein [Desertifilum sp. SIO1I2]